MTPLTTSAIPNHPHSFKPILIFRLLSVFLLLILSCNGFSQTKYLRDNYWIENYSKKDGLPEDVVVGITQDKKGFLWITTSYKLVRFDGYQFKVFDPLKDFPDLFFFFAPGLVEDNDGLIWIASNGYGLFSFDPYLEKFNRFTEANSDMAGDIVTGMGKDKGGDLYISTNKGLSRITKRNGTVNIKSFSTGHYSGKLLKLVDGIVKKQSPVANHSRVGDLQLKKQMIEIKDSADLLIVCMGEILSDYGWIENLTGTVVWKNDPLKSSPAGGLTNYLQIDALALPPGKYNVFYKSDETHSWGKWHDFRPDRPDYWGIGVYKVTDDFIDSIRYFVNDGFSKRSIIGPVIRSMVMDTDDNLWVSNTAVLQKIRIDKDSLKGEAFALPENFRTMSHLAKYDEHHLIINGTVFDSMRQEKFLSTLIIDPVTNKIDLTFDDHSFKTSFYYYPIPVISDTRNIKWTGIFRTVDDSGIYTSTDDGIPPKFQKLNITPPSAKQEFDQIFTLFEDRQGFIWVGSRQNGLYRINPTPTPVNFINVSNRGHDMSQTMFNEISTDASGNIWLSSSSEIVKFDRNKETATYFSPLVRHPNGALFINGAGNKLFISEEGELRVHDGIKSTMVSAELNVPDSLRLIGFDSFGNGWSRHKNRIDGTSFFIYNGTKFVPVSFDSSNFILGYRDLYLGRGGNIWITPAYDGIQLYRLDNETKTLVFVKEYIPLGTDVFDIYEQDDGVMWLGTYDGLVRLDPSTNSRKYFRKDQGLPSDWIVKMVPFGNKLWIITDLGSAFLNTENESITVSKELDDFIGRNFENYPGKNAAVSFNPFTFYDWATETSTNEIAIAGKGGFFTFQPEAFFPDSVSPLLNITKVVVSSTELQLLQSGLVKSFSLSYDRNDLVIEYVGINFKNASQIQYAYQLRGSDEEWVSVGHERVARYSNLSPAHYEFYLKAANADGVWSTPQKMFSFTILPPWWQTWWAYSFYTLAIVATFIYWRNYEIRRLRLKHQADHLRELDQLKTQFFNNISHEFRTPVTLIQGPLKEMYDKAVDKTERSSIGIMLRNAQRLSKLINQLLDLSKLDAGKMTLHASQIELVQFLREIASSYESLAASKSIKYFFYAEVTELLAFVDAEKIEKVVHNLLSNAFKFTREGEIALHLKTDGKHCLIAVKDTGIGIPSDQLNKVFDRFHQVDSSQTRSYEGTGLGMALAKELTELHHGTITVKSVEGKGTTFTVALLLGKDHLNSDEIIDGEQRWTSNTSPEETFMSPDAGEIVKTIESNELPVLLIVEDNADMQHYIRRTLSDWYQIIEAENGKTGLAKAKESVPDLIISDIMMPEMDGYKLCELIKSNELTSHIPVVLLTAKADHDSKLSGLNIGADDYLSKPFDAEELKLIVRNRIVARQRMQERFSREITLEPRQIAITSLDEKFLTNVLTIIEAHMDDENFSIDELSREAGYSNMHFYRKIKALAGQTPSQFLRTIRLMRAAELLRNNSDNVTQIAYSVGFSSLSYFNKCFKEHFGVTPGQFEKNKV